MAVLEFGYVTDEHAIFQDFKKLPPGTILEWQDGQMVERRYWQLPEPRNWQLVYFLMQGCMWRPVCLSPRPVRVGSSCVGSANGLTV